MTLLCSGVLCSLTLLYSVTLLCSLILPCSLMYILCPMFWCPGEQVPDGILQPAEVQHGRAEAAEEAEDQESYPLIDLAACTLEKPRLNKDFFTFG